jgi:hypothetical protein
MHDDGRQIAVTLTEDEPMREHLAPLAPSPPSGVAMLVAFETMVYTVVECEDLRGHQALRPRRFLADAGQGETVNDSVAVRIAIVNYIG